MSPRRRQPTRFVALLRGVNVSGHRKVPMAELRGLCESIGLGDARTYLQSGNVVFTSEVAPAAVGRALEAAIEAELGVTTTVLLRSKEALDSVVEHNPFLRASGGTESLYVTFLAAGAAPARRAVLDQTEVDAGPDEFAVSGTEVYLSCPGGYGRTKLNNSFFERRLAVTATTRNWKSVVALAEMAGH
jgi:uncharacterized protein (DUF1697 family)